MLDILRHTRDKLPRGCNPTDHQLSMLVLQEATSALHILPEVEMMCSRVIVIHRGQIRATDTAENLRKNHRAVGELILEAKAGPDAVDALKAIPTVKDVAATPDGDWMTFTLRLDANAEPGAEIMRLAMERKWEVREIHQKRATLEDVFAELTTSEH